MNIAKVPSQGQVLFPCNINCLRSQWLHQGVLLITMAQWTHSTNFCDFFSPYQHIRHRERSTLLHLIYRAHFRIPSNSLSPLPIQSPVNVCGKVLECLNAYDLHGRPGWSSRLQDSAWPAPSLQLSRTEQVHRGCLSSFIILPFK